jgi:hypothetical protein
MIKKVLHAGKSAAPVALPLIVAVAAGVTAYHLFPAFKAQMDAVRGVIGSHPLAFAIASTGLTMGFLPDLFAQRYEGKPFNYRRSAGMTLASGLYYGIVARAFYDLQAALFPGGGVGNTVKQILVDQFCYTPTYLFGYLACVNAIDGKNGGSLFHGVGGKIAKILPINWVYWGLMALPILYNMPQDLKIYTMQFFSIIWLSFQTKTAFEPPAVPSEVPVPL